MKKRRFLVVLLILFSGCNKEKAPSIDSAILKHVIVQYNRLLAEGYRTLNMNTLVQVATEERATKAYYHMAALGEERKRMDSTQTKIDFLDIRSISPEQAEVKTREEWSYKHVNIDSLEVEYQDSILYEMKYTLVRKNDQWFVSDITVEAEKSLKPPQPLEKAPDE